MRPEDHLRVMISVLALLTITYTGWVLAQLVAEVAAVAPRP